MPVFAVGNRSAELEDIRGKIAAQFEVTLGNVAVVDELCQKLIRLLHHPPLPADVLVLEDLAPHLRIRVGPIAESLFGAIEQFVAECDSPWPILQDLLCVRDESLVPRALSLLHHCMARGEFRGTSNVLEFLAKRCDEPGGVYQQSGAMTVIGRIVECMPVADGAESESHAQSLYQHAHTDSVRRLGARVLDLSEKLPSPALSSGTLGREAYEFLSPLLEFTRSTHLDVLRLAISIRDGSSLLSDLRASQGVCGPDILRQIISEVGWSGLNQGLLVRQCIGVSVTGSLPLMLSPEEVLLFQSCGEAQRVSDAYLVIGHGSIESSNDVLSGGNSRIDRFRAYNLTHAELLELILRVEPLSRIRVCQILERMDRIVDDYRFLYSSLDVECVILEEVYSALKTKILAELSEGDEAPQLSPELTRLVQMFEEPRSLGTVRTLHGLKRYLHQQGLRLSFGLLETGRPFSRTVEVMSITPNGDRLRAKTIRYADFEPESTCGTLTAALPYAVAVVAEGFGRQLLYGHEQYPSVDIFCYGNEVHYYLSYRNHPAFVRIDYSPPLRGGMIDLEYYGVSNYEVGVHPNISLDAVQLFFRELDFEVGLTGTRIHARCDKESITNLGTLCEKAEALFRLAPYFMDIDWVIGSLEMSQEAKRRVAEAWAESFALWGVLPVRQLLTADRKGILETIVTNPSGAYEVAWSGHGDYRDAFTIPPPLGFFERMSRKLETLEVETLPLYVEDSRRPMGQVRLEQRLFAPLRSAVRHGELAVDAEGFRRLPQNLFECEHEATRFAEIIHAGLDVVTQAVIIARVITPLERMLRFTTTGAVQAYEVQRATLPLRGERFVLYIMRHPDGSIRMAFYSPEGTLCRQRQAETDDWTTNWQCDIDALASQLRRNSYFVTGPELSLSQAKQEAASELNELRTSPVPMRPEPISGERVMQGLSASPGRVTGAVHFGTESRSPEDLKGMILVADSLRPDDNAFLYHCAGVLTTGGGVLSHAGLMAIQFSKPAMVIPGRWQRERDGSRSLLYLVEEFTEEICQQHGLQVVVRRNVRQREYTLREGDIVTLDATRSLVTVLGQTRDIVSLQDGMRLLREENRSLSISHTDSDRLQSRGREIRARYMMEKMLSRLTDPVIGRYAVHELLLGTLPSLPDTARCESENLLAVLMRNPRIGEDARSFVTWTRDQIQREFETAWSKAHARIPVSTSLFEILTRRRTVHRLYALLSSTIESLRRYDIACPILDPEQITVTDRLTNQRLLEIRDNLKQAIRHGTDADPLISSQRHLLRRLQQLEALLGVCPINSVVNGEVFRHASSAIPVHMRSRRVLRSDEGGLIYADLIGWKAANLAEIEVLFSADVIPPWFVVTDAAFQEVLGTPMTQLSPGRRSEHGEDFTLRKSIAIILARPDLNNHAKSQLVRSLWDGITLPAPLTEEILAAYHEIEVGASAVTNVPFVALRSSSREEDADIAARAGEFETFLYVRGNQPLLEHLKRTWGSLWTERALHNRAVLGIGEDAPGGGVIIQRIVPSRVSGVVLTINVANDDPDEMVVNAGYGLGEGVVSGKVAADQVTVLKEQVMGASPMRFKYKISDKRERVVFNDQIGAGTVMTTTLYHQRLRPALEYIELKELVALANRFEEMYGYPLDIEFAFEDTRLWILQVRPVATYASIIRETLEKYPLFLLAQNAPQTVSLENVP